MVDPRLCVACSFQSFIRETDVYLVLTVSEFLHSFIIHIPCNETESNSTVKKKVMHVRTPVVTFIPTYTGSCYKNMILTNL